MKALEVKLDTLAHAMGIGGKNYLRRTTKRV
jgi:hypothetical protein